MLSPACATGCSSAARVRGRVSARGQGELGAVVRVTAAGGWCARTRPARCSMHRRRTGLSCEPLLCAVSNNKGVSALKLYLCCVWVSSLNRTPPPPPPPPPRRPPQARHQADCGYRAIRGRRKGAVRLGNGNESDSSAPTIRLATLIRGARTAAGGERARILGVGASTAASTPGDFLGSARRRHLICARAHLLRRAPQLATT